METRQEAKSLPRNRKCGNCRYFEPAPLWRKGWCRNPRLYDRRANHLVDAATIDCEQVFRARIYWEPVPISEMDTPTPVGSAVGGNAGYNAFGDAPGSADGGAGRPTGGDGVLRPRSGNVSPIQRGGGDGSNLPMIVRRERAGAAPGLVAKPSRLRRWLVENIPYYDKIDGPISRLSLRVIPWLVVAILLIVVVMNILGGGKKGNSTDQNSTSPTQAVTPSLVLGNTTPSAAANQTSSGKVVGTPTPTISNAVPTATPVPTPTATPKAEQTTATVKNAGPKGLNMRKDAGKTGEIIQQIPDGAVVTIASGDFKKLDGITWIPISYKGVNGWVAQDYLEKNS